MKTTVDLAATFALAAILFGMGAILADCAEPPKQPTVQQAAAEGAYTADLVACVEQANTLAESKACRAETNRRWGVVETRSAR